MARNQALPIKGPLELSLRLRSMIMPLSLSVYPSKVVS